MMMKMMMMMMMMKMMMRMMMMMMMMMWIGRPFPIPLGRACSKKKTVPKVVPLGPLRGARSPPGPAGAPAVSLAAHRPPLCPVAVGRPGGAGNRWRRTLLGIDPENFPNFRDPRIHHTRWDCPRWDPLVPPNSPLCRYRIATVVLKCFVPVNSPWKMGKSFPTDIGSMGNRRED